MTKFLALIAVAALMVSDSDPAFAGRRHRNCCCRGQYFQAGWSGAQYGNGQANWSNNAGYYNGQAGGYTTQGQIGVTNDGQAAPVPVTTGYPPNESSLDANANSSIRGNVAPSGAAARQGADVKAKAPLPVLPQQNE